MTLVRRGHEVCVLAANRGYEDPSRRYLPREVRDQVNIRRIPLRSFGKSNSLARLTGALSFVVQAAVSGVLLRQLDLILVSTVPPLGPRRLMAPQGSDLLLDSRPEPGLGHSDGHIAGRRPPGTPDELAEPPDPSAA